MEIEFVDIVVAVVLTVAVLRGLLLGLIREAFSLLGLAAAYLLIRSYVVPAADGLDQLTGGAIPGGLSPWIVGSVIFIFTVAAVTGVGRAIRRSLRAAGLGLMDRMGGGLLGAAEGILVVALLFNLAADFLGRDHPTLTDTYTLSMLEQLERVFQGSSDVNI